MPIRGYKQTEEHIENRMVNGNGKIGFQKGHGAFPNNHTSLGMRWTEKQRKNLSKSLKGRPPTSGMKGKYQTEKAKRKMKESAIKRGILPPLHEGENCHFWKGGITDYPYPENWTDNLKESIRQRDNYTCQLCGFHQDELIGWNKKLDIHHIDYDKDNLNPLNLITLCRSCHIKTNQNRDYWTNYFTNR